MAKKRLAWAELRVGILVITSFAILTFAIVLIGGKAGFFTRTYDLRTYLPSASGLKKGSLVWVAGIEAGNVHSVDFSSSPDPRRAVQVTMRVTRNFQRAIREDSVASLGSIGLLGDKYLDISRGTDASPMITPDGEIRSSSEADIKKIIQNSNDLVANLGDLVDKINAITSKIDKGQGTIGKFINDPSLYNKLNQTVEEAQGVVVKLKSGDGSLGKFINDPELYRHLNNTLARVDSVMSKVENGEGTLGKLIHDKSLYDRTNLVLEDVKTVSSRLARGEGFLGRLSKEDALYVQFRDTVQKLDELASRINRGEGTLGKLATDQALYNNLNTAITELVKLLYDFRQDPKRFLRIKVGLF